MALFSHEDSARYLEEVRGRGRKSKIYAKHQLLGLDIARQLADTAHTALYMKLAKQYDERLLLSLSKRVVENARVKNKGAYFMRLLQMSHENSDRPQPRRRAAPPREGAGV